MLSSITLSDNIRGKPRALQNLYKLGPFQLSSSSFKSKDKRGRLDQDREFQTGVVAHTCYASSTWKTKAGRVQGRSQFELHTESLKGLQG